MRSTIALVERSWAVGRIPDLAAVRLHQRDLGHGLAHDVAALDVDVGRSSSTRRPAVGSSNATRWSTQLSAASTCARSSSEVSGRAGPFSRARRTRCSVRRRAGRRAPVARFSRSMWPRCSMSKQPLVKTTRRPAPCAEATRSLQPPRPPIGWRWSADTASRSSAAEQDGGADRLVTTAAAAWASSAAASASGARR